MVLLYGTCSGLNHSALNVEVLVCFLAWSAVWHDVPQSSTSIQRWMGGNRSAFAELLFVLSRLKHVFLPKQQILHSEVLFCGQSSAFLSPFCTIPRKCLRCWGKLSVHQKPTCVCLFLNNKHTFVKF